MHLSSFSRPPLLIALQKKLKQAIYFIDENIPIFNENISSINQLFKNLNIPESFSNLTYSDDQKLKEKLKFVEDEIKLSLKNIEKAQNEIEKSHHDQEMIN